MGLFVPANLHFLRQDRRSALTCCPHSHPSRALAQAPPGLSCQLFILLLLSLMPKLPLLLSEEKGAGGMSWKSFRRPGVLINRASRDQRPRRFAPPPEGVGLMPSPESGGLSVFHRTSKNTGMRSTSLVVMPLKYHRWICR